MRISDIEKHLIKNGIRYIAGVDEAGRGPIAGPVVAAAVIFKSFPLPFEVFDSKRISPRKREELYELIKEHALAIGVGRVSHKVIDRINILQATFRAMQRALHKLEIVPQLVLVDGRQIPDLPYKQKAIIKGDDRCASIAAASIVAKVVRDRMMERYDRKYPQYEFAKHKGYPTKKHLEAIHEFGYCPIHRLTFHVKNLQVK